MNVATVTLLVSVRCDTAACQGGKLEATDLSAPRAAAYVSTSLSTFFSWKRLSSVIPDWF